jgi:H+-transporting ATPase
MKTVTDQPKAPESKPGSKPDSKDDLKSLPMPEVEKKLGSSPDGLTQAEAAKRLTQYGPNEIEEKKTNELYEREGHRDGHAVEDWSEAEREIRKDKAHK